MEHILSLSYGKDSLACLGAIEELRWPLERIVHVEVFATNTMHADLPPMVEFKKKADTIIKERWGIEVEHVRSNVTYEDLFYRVRGLKSKNPGAIYGWPTAALKGSYCSGELKQNMLKKLQFGKIAYIGIAVDEPERFHNLTETKKSPLVEGGWTEAMCWDWCEKNDLLSPIYTTATQGGCWFCHNQSVNQLRLLRRNYPEYWALMLKWDRDSPVSFYPPIKKKDGTIVRGKTVHDLDLRFQAEDDGFISEYDKSFRWDILDTELNYRWF